MDSINVFKGYGKVNPFEDQSSHQNNTARKPLITVVISLIILLTVIIGAMIGALIHDSSTESAEASSLSANSAESIRAVCSVTQYPDSCFTSISSVNTNTPPKTDPERIFNLSLQVAIDELSNLSSLPKTLISKSNDPRSESALRDCVSLFDEALSQLNRSASSMDVCRGEKVLTEAKISDMKTWISASMTDQETCLDGLEEMGSTVLDEVRTKVQKSREYMSNSLAILSSIQTVLEKFDLTMH
uniref:pectinesterase n=1 Tax=Davidia involucrata TaxID=16924 RepID=A0A5B7BTU6_DAVIN